MVQFNYALDQAQYTWENALLWGNFKGHFEKAQKEHSVVHALIALAELIPVISQIASIFEKLIVTCPCIKAQQKLDPERAKVLSVLVTNSATAGTTAATAGTTAAAPMGANASKDSAEPSLTPSGSNPAAISDTSSASTAAAAAIAAAVLSGPTQVPVSSNQSVTALGSTQAAKQEEEVKEMGMQPKGLKDLKSLNLKSFAQVNSRDFVPLKGNKDSDHFFMSIAGGTWERADVVLSSSPFANHLFVEHLMRNKKNLACSVKYEKGDKITIMEGVLHSFVTAILPITVLGDYNFSGGAHQMLTIKEGYGRKVILSTAIHPDFQYDGTRKAEGKDEVVMKLVRVQSEPVVGKAFATDFTPLSKQCHGDEQAFAAGLEKYERTMLEGMIYSLTQGHRLPAIDEISEDNIFDFDEYSDKNVINYLEKLIQSGEPISDQLCNKFLRNGTDVISLEVFFNFYIHQLRNEFSVFEQLLTQGYIYTIDPPAIFAVQIKDVCLLNRLQLLAFKYLKQNSDFSNLKCIGFNDYADPAIIGLYQQVFPNVKVCKKRSLYSDDDKFYSVKEDYAIVLHNNSDAFGQNIQFEGGVRSLDGALSHSDAGAQLDREDPNLVRYMV